MNIIVNGCNYNIHDREDFSRMLENELGYDVARLYEELGRAEGKALQKRMELDSVRNCTGECDRIMMVREHYAGRLNEIAEELTAIYNAEITKYKNPHCTGIARIIREIEV